MPKPKKPEVLLNVQEALGNRTVDELKHLAALLPNKSSGTRKGELLGGVAAQQIQRHAQRRVAWID